MIGTGVFTSLGFQLLDVRNTWTIIILWTIGGLLALIGAFTYAELGTHFRESGGDYIFLSRIFHPFFGYLYAWTSLCVGFSAPIAIAAMAMVSYLKPINPDIFNEWSGIMVIVALTAFHSISIRKSEQLQNWSTLPKVVFVLILIIIGFSCGPADLNALQWNKSWTNEVMAPGFAVALIYVTYAYTGWNSSAYIIDELLDPVKDLPKSLIGGTFFVMLVYILLQIVFLKHASTDALEGQIEVASIAFSNIINKGKAYWISYLIALQLLATISGYLWIGSRIVYAMAVDHPLWKGLAFKNKFGVPTRALWMQALISILLTLTGSFEQVLLYSGFVLQLMGTLTVASLLKIKKKKGTFESPFKPYLQIGYILFSVWVLVYVLFERPFESLIGLGIVGIGGITYFIKPFRYLKS